MGSPAGEVMGLGVEEHNSVQNRCPRGGSDTSAQTLGRRLGRNGPSRQGAEMTADMTGSDEDRPRLFGSGLLRQAARSSDSYGLVLGLVLIDYVLLSVGWTGGWALVVQTGFVGLTALIGFHTSHVRGRLLTAVRVACGIALVAALVYAIAEHGGHVASRAQGVLFVIVALLVFVTPVAIISRIMKHAHVTAETLLGAICVYVLLGLVFAYADLSVQYVGGLHSFFAQSGVQGAPAFVYYSFITMTTVGYGDLTPAAGVPRTMAVTEALMGQIFLVVLVSRLVAMYTPRAGGSRLQVLREARAGESPAQPDGGDGPSDAGTP